MKRGTESIVRVGKSVAPASFSGINVLSTVVLGKKESATEDFNGLFITDAILLGKKISRSAIVTATVHGTSPLSLPSAVSGSLSYVKAFGGTEQRNLPYGYLQRQFIYMLDESYIDTGIVPDNTGKIEMVFQTTSISTRNAVYLGARTNTSTGSGVSIAHSNEGEIIADNFGTRFSAAIDFANDTKYSFVFNNGTLTISSGGSVLYTNTSTPTDTTTNSLYINALNNAGTAYGNFEGIYLYSFKVWNAQGALVADYVPAVQTGAVPVVGFYDTVSKTFKTATAGTFAAGGEAVPMPGTPMDIVSNNGVLKARHQSGLPLGYTLLDYIESTGTQYIDTDINAVGASSYGAELKYVYPTAQTGRSLIGAWEGDSYSAFGQPFTESGSFSALYIGKPNTRTNAFAYTAETIITDSFSVNVSGGSVTRTFNGTTQTTSSLDFSSPTTLTCYLFAVHRGGGAQQISSARMYYAKLYKDNVLVFDGVPVKRNSDNAIGMYDMVSGQFFGNQGTGTFVAGNTVTDPVEIYTDGTVETLWMHGKNLAYFSDDNMSAGSSASYTVTNNGIRATTNDPYGRVGFIYNVTPGAKYTISFTGCSNGNYRRVYLSDINPAVGGWANNLGATILLTGTPSNVSVTVTPQTNVLFLGLYININNTSQEKQVMELSNVQIERGSTATAYEPYYNGDTATAEILLKIGDYQDVQSILDGVVTRNIGVKVLDGTEDWQAGTGQYTGNFYVNGLLDNAVYPSDIFEGTNVICSHFACVTTLSDFTSNKTITTNSDGGRTNLWSDKANVDAHKQYLADQYNAGTPVIFIYPLATPTTETVIGQTLQVTAGDNVLEITQASLNDLELEVQYKKRIQ